MDTNKNNNPFICTFQKDIADELLKNGFTLVSEENNKYTFLNDGCLKFDKETDNKITNKICYTNVLCI